LSTAKKFAGQTAIYGLSTVAARSLNFLLTKLYVAVYPAKIYGIFTTMYSYASMLNAILAFGMETTFFRYLSKYENDKARVYNNAFLAIGLISLVFLSGIFLFIGDITLWVMSGGMENYRDYVTYIKLFACILVIDALCIVPFAKLRAEGRPGRYGLIKFLNIVFFIALNLFFMYTLPWVVKNNFLQWLHADEWFREGWIGYIFISNLLATVLTFLMLLPEIAQFRFRFNRAMLVEMFSYSWPVLIANISFIINENLDKIILGKLLPDDISVQDVGIYGACAKIAVFLSIFIQAFRLGAEPFFFSHAKNKNAGTTYARIMDYFVIAVCMIFVLLVANIELLKHFIKAKNPLERDLYWSGLKVVPLLLFGYVSLGIYMNLSVWYKLSDQTKYGLYISAAGAIVTIILNVIFIPKYSYMASAWASLAAYAIMMVLSYIWGQKNYPIPYNLKKNVAYIVSAVFIVYISFYVFNRNIFIGNGLLIAFASVALYFEWKNLKTIFIKS
jgi:O-antigen/teichoic acid export membrane protein